MERFDAAILFVDISGFTTLTEQLDLSGPTGVEQIAEILNDTFATLIDVIREYGGDVVKFAGDALWAIWPSPRNLDDVICQTLSCGMEIQKRFPVQNSHNITLRVSVSSGKISVLHVGGVFNRREMIIAGKPLITLGDADRLARPGEIVIASGYPETLLDRIKTEPREKGCLKLVDVEQRNIPVEFPRIPEDLDIEEKLRVYIPAAIIKKLDAGQSEWISEIRWLTVTFIRVYGLDYEAEDSLGIAHSFMRKLQTIVYDYMGSLNRLNVDDKGTIMLAAFGLPPLSHEDDAVRALRAMWEVRKEIARMGLRVSIGVTTGRVFCGALGNDSRREYTMHGDVVNLAARLMQKANEGWEILCDENTMRESKQYFRFETLSNQKLKGRKNLSNLYSPLDRLEERLVFHDTMVDRNLEKTFLFSKMDELQKNGSGGVVILEGDAGSGKSMLVSLVMKRAEAMFQNVAYAGGNAINKAYPYYALQGLFAKILRKTDKAILFEMIRDSPLTDQRLHEAFIPAFRRRSASAESWMLDDSQEVRETLLRIVQSHFANKKVLFVIEDAKWVDIDSWKLLLELKNLNPLILFLISTRIRSASTGSKPFYFDPRTVCVKLEPMREEEIGEVISVRSNGRIPDPELLRLVFSRSEGNPLFALEVMESLYSGEYLVSEAGFVRISPDQEQKIKKIPLLNSQQGIFTERLDRLPVEMQMTLKVASVIGLEFGYSVLKHIYPVPITDEELTRQLEDLDNYDFIIKHPSSVNPSYRFKHVHLRDTTYNLLLSTRRKRLHHAIANFYETHSFSDRVHLPPPDILGEHWYEAGEYDRAVDCYFLSATQKMENRFAVDAECDFRTAFDIIENNLPDCDETKRFKVIYGLSRMLLRTGKLPEAKRLIERVLDAFQISAPDPSVSIFLLIARDYLHFSLPARGAEHKKGRAAYLYLSKLLLLSVEIDRENFQYRSAFLSVVRGLNLQKQGENRGDTGKLYAMLALLLRFFRFETTSRHFALLALKSLHRERKSLSPEAVSSLIEYHLGSADWKKGETLIRLIRKGENRTTSDFYFAILKIIQGEFSQAYALLNRQFYDTHSRYFPDEKENLSLWFALVNLRQKKFKDVLEILAHDEFLEERYRKNFGRERKIFRESLLALVNSSLGFERKAVRYSLQALSLIEHASQSALFASESYSCLLDYLFTQYQHSAKEKTLSRIRMLLTALSVFSRKYRFALPRYYYYRAKYNRITGFEKKVEELLRQGEGHAQKLGLLYDQAIIRNEMSQKTAI